jgi:hypothetical protein
VTSRRLLIAIAAMAAVAALALTIGLTHHGGGRPDSTQGREGGTAPPPAPQQLVAAARWTTADQGFRLHVRPSRYGRGHADRNPARALREALRLARPAPLKLTPSARRSLDNQLRCHAVFAPRKPLWNLESWRPDVGFVATVRRLCNP